MMQDTHQVFFDGNAVDSATTFHKLIKHELQFPDYYGMNADALWDCLTETLLSGFQIEITWKAFNKSLAIMGREAEILRDTLLDVQEEYPDKLRLIIKD